jgi:hypothetical protein
MRSGGEIGNTSELRRVEARLGAVRRGVIAGLRMGISGMQWEAVMVVDNAKALALLACCGIC